MSALTQFLEDGFYDLTEAMNELQESRLISDLCVSPEDVADEDAERAINHFMMKDLVRIQKGDPDQ